MIRFVIRQRKLEELHAAVDLLRQLQLARQLMNQPDPATSRSHAPSRQLVLHNPRAHHRLRKVFRIMVLIQSLRQPPLASPPLGPDTLSLETPFTSRASWIVTSHETPRKAEGFRAFLSPLNSTDVPVRLIEELVAWNPDAIAYCRLPSNCGTRNTECGKGYPMNQQMWTAGSILLLFLSSASRAEEKVLTVSPADMQGWVILGNKGGQGELTNRGPAVFERELPFVAEDGLDLGKGAYYAALGFEDGTTPPTVWLGLDTFQGRPWPASRSNRSRVWITTLTTHTSRSELPIRSSGPVGKCGGLIRGS
jgi:hypothetical protein